MDSPTQPRKPRIPPWLTVTIIITVFCGSILWCIVGITGFFRLSSETSTLRTTVMRAIPGEWDKKIALRVGWFTTSALRIGAQCFEMPSEPRAALAALHGADVGIYRFQQRLTNLKPQAVLRAADEAMRREGWERILGVAEGRELVAVYLPHRNVSPERVKCCALVLQDQDLIVASVRCNLNPIFKLAREHISLEELKRQLPSGL